MSKDCAICWNGKRSPLLLDAVLYTSLLLMCGLWIGCSNLPPRIHPPSVDFGATTEWAFSRCDQDNDGSISEAEAVHLPALERRFSSYDTDDDGKIVPEEFKKRLTRIFDRRAALVGATCFVSHDGRPLAGAVVRFEPVEILAEVIPPAEGVTDEQGSVDLAMADEDLPAGTQGKMRLLRTGLYRVVITHPTREIPAKYNQETTLGEEVSRDTIMAGAFQFALEGN